MVRSIQQLESLRDEWDALAAPFESPLLEHDWFLSCAEAFHRDEDLRVFTTWEGHTLSGAAPLTWDGSRLALLGSSRLYEPCDWLHASEQALAELVDRTVGSGRPLMLHRMPAESAVVRLLAALPRRRAVPIVRATASALGVSTRGTWDTYYGTLSSHVTSNLPRLRRRAQKVLGPMTVEHRSPTVSEVDAHFETVMAVEGSGWKGRGGSSLGSQPNLRDFFRRYCHRAAEKGRLRVSTLTFGPHVAAVELSVEAYRRVWQLKIGYQASLSAYYPGLHLTEASIRSAFERGLVAYEFLGSAAPWEERWRPDVRRYQTVAVYPTTVTGVTRAGRDVAGAAWRRLSALGT